MKIYTLNEILRIEHLGGERYVRYEEIERLKEYLKKYGLHKEGCGIECYHGEPIDSYKCTCGFTQALKDKS